MSRVRHPHPPASVEAHRWGWRHTGRTRWAVRDIDLRIDPGERVLLLGASGSGKSTLLAGLAGILGGADEGEQQGHLLVAGRRAERARGEVGLVLQDPDSQTVMARLGDDVAFSCENLGVPREEIWVRVRAALGAVGLDLPLDHPTSDLSGGQRQRLALAGVLAMQPGLVLLDEPTANLDPDGVLDVRDAVADLLAHSTATFIVVEHRVDVWLEVVDRVIVLGDKGGVLADGPVSHVLDRQRQLLAGQGIWVPGFRAGHTARTSTAGDVAIRTEDLAIARVANQPVQAGIDVEVRFGQLAAITGPNGSGKSTLGLTLGGLLPPESGRVLATGVCGQLVPDPIRWRSRELVTRIGSVFQDPEHQFVAATVRAEMLVGPRVAGMRQDAAQRIVDEILERLRLAPLQHVNPFTLSGGEKRRLSVATALATRPPVIILDEPTFGQDLVTWRELVDLMGELLGDGIAIAAVTHDEQFIQALADTRFEFFAWDVRPGQLEVVA